MKKFIGVYLVQLLLGCFQGWNLGLLLFDLSMGSL